MKVLQSGRSYFSLLELLVVIGVIGVLLSILFPALASIRVRGKEAQAKADMTAFANACRLFESDYGVLPNPDTMSPGSPVEFAATDSSTFAKASVNTKSNYMLLLSTLTGFKYLESSAYSSSINPRGGKYLPPMANYTAANTKEPCGFVDPWGNSYGLALDIDGDGQVSIPYPSGMKDANGNAQSAEAVISRVAIYSLGANVSWSGTTLLTAPQKPVKSWK